MRGRLGRNNPGWIWPAVQAERDVDAVLSVGGPGRRPGQWVPWAPRQQASLLLSLVAMVEHGTKRSLGNRGNEPKTEKGLVRVPGGPAARRGTFPGGIEAVRAAGGDFSGVDPDEGLPALPEAVGELWPERRKETTKNALNDKGNSIHLDFCCSNSP